MVFVCEILKQQLYLFAIPLLNIWRLKGLELNTEE